MNHAVVTIVGAAVCEVWQNTRMAATDAVEAGSQQLSFNHMRLPAELADHVFEFLSPLEILSTISLVSKRQRGAITAHRFWAEMYLKRQAACLSILLHEPYSFSHADLETKTTLQAHMKYSCVVFIEKSTPKWVMRFRSVAQ